MQNLNRFYTYAYLREGRTPYYIGKGSGERINQNKGRFCNKPTDKSRIIYLKQNLTEEEAFRHEKYMIAVFGRKDLGTGILHNRTDGGEGSSGFIVSKKTKRKLSEKKKGQNNPNYGKTPSEETRRKQSDAKRGITISEETRRKQSEAMKGKNNPNYGKTPSEETKRKKSEVNKNKKWWNDGLGNAKFVEECPDEGWVLGRGKIKKR
jgi:hypothetical protein